MIIEKVSFFSTIKRLNSLISSVCLFLLFIFSHSILSAISFPDYNSTHIDEEWSDFLLEIHNIKEFIPDRKNSLELEHLFLSLFRSKYDKEDSSIEKNELMPPSKKIEIDYNEVMAYAQAAMLAYYPNLEQEYLPEGYELSHEKTDSRLDLKTIYLLNKDKKKMIIAFRGTVSFKNILANFAFLFDSIYRFSFISSIIQKATEYVSTVPSDYEVVLTGHSFGGWMAQYAALNLGYPARVFASPAVDHEHHLKSLEEKGIFSQARTIDIVNFYIAGDPIVEGSGRHRSSLVRLPIEEESGYYDRHEILTYVNKVLKRAPTPSHISWFPGQPIRHGLKTPSPVIIPSATPVILRPALQRFHLLPSRQFPSSSLKKQNALKFGRLLLNRLR